MPQQLNGIRDQGFTLIETLVSIMIMAITMTVILQLFSGGLNAARVSEGYTRAVFHAREKMEELLLFESMADSEIAGDFEDGYSWTAVIEYKDEAEESGRTVRKSPLELFEITVDIKWFEGNKEKHFDISTITIADRIENEKRS